MFIPLSTRCVALLCRIKSQIWDLFRRTFATQEYMKGAELKKIASYIGDLESTTSEYYITVKSNIIMGGKVMNVTPFPMKGSGT